jgi:hypothetical protein
MTDHDTRAVPRGRRNRITEQFVPTALAEPIKQRAW